jgi:hypothetical protein
MVVGGDGTVYVSLSAKNIKRLLQMLDDEHAIRVMYKDGPHGRVYVEAEPDEKHYAPDNDADLVDLDKRAMEKWAKFIGASNEIIARILEGTEDATNSNQD